MKIIAGNIKGFTLAEIMIVVAIIGLLTCVAIPNFMQARKQARKNTCINNLRLIDGAKEQYALENNADTGTTMDDTKVAPYMKSGSVPVCLTGNAAYAINPIGTLPTCSSGVADHKLS